MELEKHYVTKAGWLRAAVLGANDGKILKNLPSFKLARLGD